MKNDSDLFYTCSLIEFIGRKQKLRRGDVVRAMGRKVVSRIYRHADVLHSDIIAKVADEFIEYCDIPTGDFDNVPKARYLVPDYWTIGEVYERLIEDVAKEDGSDLIDRLLEVYSSWISDAISNYNTDFYYQSREYIALCYKEGEILD